MMFMLIIRNDNPENEDFGLYWDYRKGEWGDLYNGTKYDESDQVSEDLPENGIWMPYIRPPSNNRKNNSVLANAFIDHLTPEEIIHLLVDNIANLYGDTQDMFDHNFQEMLEIFAEFGQGEKFLEEFDYPNLRLAGD